MHTRRNEKIYTYRYQISYLYIKKESIFPHTSRCLDYRLCFIYSSRQDTIYTHAIKYYVSQQKYITSYTGIY